MLYTDPGSGALIWQMAGAAALGALFYIRRLFALVRNSAVMSARRLRRERNRLS